MNQKLNTNTSLEEIDRQLESALDGELIADVLLFRQQRFAHFSKVLEKMALSSSEPSGHSSAPKMIKADIAELGNIIESQELFVARIIDGVQNVAETMPEEVFLTQSEQRFEAENKEALFIKTAKWGKRLARGLGKTNWQQHIPLRKATAFHLFDATDLFTKWIDEDGQLFLQIILELEDALASLVKDLSVRTVPSDMQQLLKKWQLQIEERKQGLEQELNKARDDLKTGLLSIISQVDTAECRSGLYRNKRLQKKQSVTHEHLLTYTQKWQDVLKKMLNKTATLQQFSGLTVDIELQTKEFCDTINTYFSEFFIKALQGLQQKIEETSEEIRKDPGDSSEVITAQKNRLLKHLDAELIDSAQAALDEGKLQKLIENYTGQLISAAAPINEQAPFILKFNENACPPEIKSRLIEWRLLVVRSIKEHMLSKLKPDNAPFSKSVCEQFDEIKSIREIIDINLSSAAELKNGKSAEENAAEIADEALERSKLKIKKCEDKLELLRNEICNPVIEGQNKFHKNMLDLLYQSDNKALSVLDAKYKVSEKTHTWKTRLGAGWARTQDRATVFTRFIGQKGKHYYKKWATTLGLKKKEVKEAHKADIAAYLSETEQRLENLPYIYRELFSIKTAPDRRNYVGVNENFGIIRQAFERWKEGHRLACAVVGEKGSGKSTYINLIEKELFNQENVWHLDLTQTCVTKEGFINLFSTWFGKEDITNIDELADFLQHQKKQKVILVEGIHNLYLRHLNGYEAIEKLIYLISETSDNIFWVVSCSKYAWEFLEKAADIRNYFSYVIRTDTLNDEQIKRIILNRHRNSGYELVFETDETYKKNRAYRKLMDKEEKAQEHLREKYFKELTKLSKGNASIAMIFWIRSVREFNDTHFFMAPLEVAPLETLDDLQAASLFVFAALVLHDVINVEELALVLGIDQKESRLILNRLFAKGIAVVKDDGMALNQLIYRQVIEELKERNILHLG